MGARASCLPISADRDGVRGRGKGLFSPVSPTLKSPRHHHPHPSPGLKRGVCVKINHFPEDTDYDHDSAEYLLRTWGSGTDLGHCRGWARGGKGAGHLDRPAEMSVPANPSAETFSGLRLAPWFLSRPLLSPWGGLRRDPGS